MCGNTQNNKIKHKSKYKTKQQTHKRKRENRKDKHKKRNTNTKRFKLTKNIFHFVFILNTNFIDSSQIGFFFGKRKKRKRKREFASKIKGYSSKFHFHIQKMNWQMMQPTMYRTTRISRQSESLEFRGERLEGPEPSRRKKKVGKGERKKG